MADTREVPAWRQTFDESAATALGREHRADPVLPGTGGPAGNARLTAWVGLVLLVLVLAELVTLLDVHGLITWHLALGIVLIPPALLKTASTGWRIVRYYSGSPAYREAGPPPLLLRLLGPLVVLTTVALLGTGLALVLVGAAKGHDTLFTLAFLRWNGTGLQQAPLGVGLLSLHKAAFLVWAVVTGLHALARIVPMWRLVRMPGGQVPGAGRRLTGLVVAGAVAVAALAWVLAHQGGWQARGFLDHGHHDGRSGAGAVRLQHRILRTRA